jgi:hypothetical protein
MAESAEIDSKELIMRSRLAALLAAVIGLALIPAAAEAGHRHHHHGKHHHYKFYHKHYRSDWGYDPFAYEFSPRRYYPYYNSGHWRPTYELRYRRYHYRPYASLPPYYKAWGYPTRYYYGHRKWHRRHHGYRHRHW